MAEEEEAQEEGEEESAPAAVVRPARQPSLLRYLPIVLFVMLLQAGGAYFAIEEFLFPGEKTAVEYEEGRPRTIPEGEDPEAAVDLGEMLANPRGTRARLLVRASVTLGVAPSGVVGEIENEENSDRVRDAVLWELGNATYEDLEMPEGRQKVKDKIKERINDFLYEGQVQKVYFEDFILQAMSGYGKRLQDIPETQQIQRPPPTPAVSIETENDDVPDDVTIGTTDLDFDQAPADLPPPPPPGSTDAPKEEEILEFWKVEEKPALKKNVKPKYPEIARKAGHEGKVFVKFMVGRNGRVQQVQVLRGQEIFHQAAIDAVMQFVFSPAMQNDKPVNVWMTQAITFKLHE